MDPIASPISKRRKNGIDSDGVYSSPASTTNTQEKKLERRFKKLHEKMVKIRWGRLNRHQNMEGEFQEKTRVYEEGFQLVKNRSWIGEPLFETKFIGMSEKDYQDRIRLLEARNVEYEEILNQKALQCIELEDQLDDIYARLSPLADKNKQLESEVSHLQGLLLTYGVENRLLKDDLTKNYRGQTPPLDEILHSDGKHVKLEAYSTNLAELMKQRAKTDDVLDELKLAVDLRCQRENEIGELKRMVDFMRFDFRTKVFNSTLTRQLDVQTRLNTLHRSELNDIRDLLRESIRLLPFDDSVGEEQRNAAIKKVEEAAMKFLVIPTCATTSDQTPNWYDYTCTCPHCTDPDLKPFKCHCLACAQRHTNH